MQQKVDLKMEELRQKEEYVKENIKIIEEYRSQPSSINVSRCEQQSNVAYQDLLGQYKALLDQYNKL